MRILVVLDPLDRLDLHGDTTYALMLEAAGREQEGVADALGIESRTIHSP